MLKGREMRLHNRRVGLFRLEDGDYLLHFRKLDEERMVLTKEIRLTPEAMDALAHLYALDLHDQA